MQVSKTARFTTPLFNYALIKGFIIKSTVLTYIIWLKYFKQKSVFYLIESFPRLKILDWILRE